MKKINKLILFGVAIAFSSCSPKYYTPNTQNVPLISEKGETNLTLSGNGNQVEFQGAYGITENIAIQANGGLFIPADLDNGNGGSGKFIEFGAGYFKPVTEKLIFETYGILGFGNFENHISDVAGGDISANILRVGIQPSLGFKSKYFSAALSSRFVNLMYSKIEGNLIYEGLGQVDYLKDNSSNFLVEPAITLRTGFEKVKLQLQYGYSINVSKNDFKQDKTYLTLGLNFTFK